MTSPATRPNRLAPFATGLLLILLALTSGGCATATLATLGTVIGVGSSAASAGSDIFGLGKLNSAEMAPHAEAIEAVRRAANDLSLKSYGPDKVKGDVTELAYIDDQNATIYVTIDRRTPTMIRVRLNVGIFGSELTARLFLSRLRAHLPRANPPDPKEDAAAVLLDTGSPRPLPNGLRFVS